MEVGWWPHRLLHNPCKFDVVVHIVVVVPLIVSVSVDVVPYAQQQGLLINVGNFR
jgi:hypothetical protein